MHPEYGEDPRAPGPAGGPVMAAVPAPPLGEVLVLAAQAWERLRAGQSLDRALEAALQSRGSAAPVAGAARMAGATRDLVTAAVRKLAVIDFVLGRLVHRAPDPAVAALLSVALAQLLVRSYSDFTVVDQAVGAARLQAQTASAGAFVNAVLRSYLRKREVLEQEAGQDPARRYNVPGWWLARLQAEHGSACEAVLAAQQEEPPMVLRVNVRRTTPQAQLAQLAAAGLPARQVGPAALWLQRACPVDRIPGFAEGLVSVQDAGAQLAAPWLDVQDGMRVLDACAAPGGKTAHLLEIADCQVDALELDPARAQRIDANLQRLGLAGPRARVLVADALDTAQYWDGVPYARILLDAPCSASGVVRRHPDLVWLRRSGDVAKLATQQGKMLRALWPLLAPAGRLLYVVCSVFAEEGQRQVAAFVRRQPDARLVRLPVGERAGLQLLPVCAASLAGADPWAAAGPDAPALPALPQLHDGFYYALLEKT